MNSALIPVRLSLNMGVLGDIVKPNLHITILFYHIAYVHLLLSIGIKPETGFNYNLFDSIVYKAVSTSVLGRVINDFGSLPDAFSP